MSLVLIMQTCLSSRHMLQKMIPCHLLTWEPGVPEGDRRLMLAAFLLRSRKMGLSCSMAMASWMDLPRAVGSLARSGTRAASVVRASFASCRALRRTCKPQHRCLSHSCNGLLLSTAHGPVAQHCSRACCRAVLVSTLRPTRTFCVLDRTSLHRRSPAEGQGMGPDGAAMCCMRWIWRGA